MNVIQFRKIIYHSCANLMIPLYKYGRIMQHFVFAQLKSIHDYNNYPDFNVRTFWPQLKVMQPNYTTCLFSNITLSVSAHTTFSQQFPRFLREAAAI